MGGRDPGASEGVLVQGDGPSPWVGQRVVGGSHAAALSRGRRPRSRAPRRTHSNPHRARCAARVVVLSRSLRPLPSVRPPVVPPAREPRGLRRAARERRQDAAREAGAGAAGQAREAGGGGRRRLRRRRRGRRAVARRKEVQVGDDAHRAQGHRRARADRRARRVERQEARGRGPGLQDAQGSVRVPDREATEGHRQDGRTARLEVRRHAGRGGVSCRRVDHPKPKTGRRKRSRAASSCFVEERTWSAAAARVFF